MKGFIIVEDTRQALPIDNTGDIGAGEVFILDMAGISIRHIFKMHIFTLKAFLKYIQVLKVFNLIFELYSTFF